MRNEVCLKKKKKKLCLNRIERIANFRSFALTLVARKLLFALSFKSSLTQLLPLTVTKQQKQPLQGGLSRATLWVETHGHNCQREFLNYSTRVESINVTLAAQQQQDGTDIKTTRQVSSSRTNKGHCHEKSETEKSAREWRHLCFVFVL